MSKSFTPAAAPTAQELNAIIRDARKQRARVVAAGFAGLGQRLRALFGADARDVQKGQNRAV